MALAGVSISSKWTALHADQSLHQPTCAALLRQQQASDKFAISDMPCSACMNGGDDDGGQSGNVLIWAGHMQCQCIQ